VSVINARLRALTASEFARPADTTAYAAGDVVGPTTTPANLSWNLASYTTGGYGKIVLALLMKNSVTVANSNFALHIFNTNITPIADNSAFTLLYANRASYQFSLLFGTVATLISGLGVGTGTDATAQFATEFYDSSSTTPVQPYYKCAEGSQTLYGVMTARGAYAPASGEQFSVRLVVEYGN
jgi:hypothetical protein